MASFPTIQSPNGLKQRNIKPVHLAQSSAGYTMARPKGTVVKKQFTIVYNMLTSAERDSLETFFDTNQGLEFSWTNPEASGKTYSVVFVNDTLSFNWVAPYYWALTFEIREV